MSDSSGFRISYTKQLRNNDVGWLQIGIPVHPIRQFIPQGLNTVNVGFCGSECTESGIPAEGVNIFANLLHAHLLGKAMSLKHIRDGVELETLDLNEHYDFNYQQMTIIPGARKLLRGDKLIMSCHYDSSSQDAITYGGLATTDEVLYCVLYCTY